MSSALLAGCEETGLIADPIGNQLSYTPLGCDYVVQTPDVEEARLSFDEFDPEDEIDHVHVSWAGPSHTSFAVNWRSGDFTTAAHVLYGTDQAAVEAAEGSGDGVSEQLGHSVRFIPMIGGGSTRIQEVHICGLSPNTTYYYKVGGPGHWSEVFDTTTGPPRGSTDSFTFAATGDSRNNFENSWSRSQRFAYDEAIDFEVFSGDAVFLGPNQRDWNDFFGASVDGFEIQDLFSRIPFMMANGNHDQLAVNYLAQFAFPQDVSEGERAQGEEWYSFDYGNAHFLMLNDTVADSRVIAGAQADWMRADLAAVDRTVTPWIFVAHHRPFYTCRSNHRPDTNLRAAWQPIFDEFSVDFVLTGHNHVYERSVPIRNLQGGEGTPAASGPNGVPVYGPDGLPSGTVYVVAAGVGANLYEVSSECSTSFVAQAVRPMVIFEIEGNRLTYNAVNVMTGQTIDSFVLER